MGVGVFGTKPKVWRNTSIHCSNIFTIRFPYEFGWASPYKMVIKEPQLIPNMICLSSVTLLCFLAFHLSTCASKCYKSNWKI